MVEAYVPKFCTYCGDTLADWNETGYCSRTEECRTARLRLHDPRRKSADARYTGDACAICGDPIASYNKTGSCSRTAECRKHTARLFQLKYKLECFNAYGGPVCTCCGETRLYFLTLDHVNGDGAQERDTAGKRRGGNAIYNHLRSLGFPEPERYQVLCFNCNCAKRQELVCPCSLERDNEEPK